jgi:P27 family predicted phage terminase small subunit
MARPSKPTQLKVIEGNKGKRANNTNEIQPAFLNDLAAPDWLPANAKLVWDELAPELRKNRVLTVMDVHALEQGCVAIANWREITLELNGDYTVNSGKSLNQLMIAQSMMFKQAQSVMQQFGMTPVARSKVMIDPQGDLFDGNKKTKGQSYLT